MRFNRWSKPVPLNLSDRQRENIGKRQQRQQQAFPLLAELIAEQQPTIAEEIAHREQAWAAWQQSWRKTRSDMWRNARRQFYALPAEQRQRLRTYWNSCRYPGNPEYLLGILHDISIGRRTI